MNINLTHYKHLLLLVSIGFCLMSCQSDYQKMESRELASGKIVNDLFLDLELGMPKKEFYATCWELNKQGVLLNGPTELSIEYIVDMPSKKETTMRFYPKFSDDKIYLMPVDYAYKGWAPWNEDLSVEILRADVLALYEQWYGEGFIEVSSEDGSQVAFVKIDGNRRIRIYKKNLSTVRAEIVDLKIQKQLEENPS
ncbi:hypothetical protein [Algoriphagus aquimarinus]|uniref:Uncharacterized protein n=1 Tax=Algoriphagus aquimarinus TaxID=237018 RepID=A0A1I0WEH1_9BACT|nr:hypothetical protein [Algoriphagus aquimarinus]SFA87145.1 hypothetical protein SAMN04489723_10299 [Algoriphagus aquimarinus]